MNLKSDDFRYLIQLDAFRAFAVLMVMFGHWMTIPSIFYIYTFFASTGVNFFFVLSGYLITKILLKIKYHGNFKFLFSIRQFYIRRFLRIFPLYYLIIIIGLLFSIPTIETDFLWFITYTGNIVAGIKAGNCAYFTHLWSLGVEEQFYIFFPFLIFLIPKGKLLHSLCFLIFLGLISRVIFFFILKSKENLLWGTSVFTPCCFDAFGFGALLAYLNVFKKEFLVKMLAYKKIFFSFFFFSILLFLLLSKNYYQLVAIVFYRFSLSIFCLWIIGKVSLSQFNGWGAKILENRILLFLGKISYGLYIYHNFMPFVFNKIGYDSKIHSVSLSSIFYLFATIIMATISWFLFELPINNMKKHYLYNKISS